MLGADELSDGDMLSLNVDGSVVAIYNVGDEFFATSDTCTHMESSLAEGYLDDDVVECELHMARFCVRDGRALCLPATVDLKTYPVRVVGDRLQVYVDVD